MGCRDASRIFPGKGLEDWELVGLKDKSIDEVRRIRDDIKRRVEELLAELRPDGNESPSATMA